MDASVGQVFRIVGLAVGLAGMVRLTWAHRGAGRFAVWELIRRELAATPRIPGAVAVSTAAGVALVAAPVTWLLATGRASLTIDARVLDGAAVAIVLTIAAKLLLVFFEELIFRAGVIGTFAGRLGVAGAAVLGAAAFAAAHGRSTLGSAILLVDGIGFGIAYATTRSLRAPVAWHAAKNLAVWLLVGPSTIEFAASPFRLSPSSPGTGPHPAELATAVVMVAIASAWFLRSAAARQRAPSRALDTSARTATTA